VVLTDSEPEAVQYIDNVCSCTGPKAASLRLCLLREVRADVTFES
jgi:hypothetical protein